MNEYMVHIFGYAYSISIGKHETEKEAIEYAMEWLEVEKECFEVYKK